MRRGSMSVSRLACVFAVLVLFNAAVCSANLITYIEGSPNAVKLKVMEETGDNLIEISDQAIPVFGISPVDPEGNSWVLFSWGDEEVGYAGGLYKIRADSIGGVEKVLCSLGTDADGTEYLDVWDAQWSPDGRQILVLSLAEEAIYLLPSDFAVGNGASGPDCASPMVPIFRKPGIQGTAAWNGDGSKIAFFRLIDDSNAVELVLLERSGTEWIPGSVEPDPAGLEIPDNFNFLDWQRAGNLLAFVGKEWVGKKVAHFLKTIDANTGEWTYLREDGEPLTGYKWGGTSPSWGPDDSQLIFTNSGGYLVKWTYPSGPGVVLGRGTNADWQRDPLLVSSCTTDLECDDSNVCTFDSCVEGNCEHDPLSVGDCGSGGWCVEGSCFEPECSVAADCEDFNECTTEECVGYACVVTDVAAGSFCTDDDDCTDDACDGAGVCESVFNPENPDCEPVCKLVGDACDTGADCCSGLCHPVKGVCK